MPELPEVEIIKIFLAQNIVGLKLKSINILNPKSFIGNPDLLVNKKITAVERRAKVLRIQFEGFEILTHLKMSGQLIWEKNYESRIKGDGFTGGHPTKDMYLKMPNKSTRVTFNLSDGSKLFFNDQRKFGWIKIRDKRNEISDKFMDKLGPEPLEKGFSWQVLKENLLKRKKTAVKVALLDQQVVAGVGNIYACEACFLAGVDPRDKCEDLTDDQFKKIYIGIVESLKNGIRYGGSSRTHFIDPEGKKGLFLDYAFVYGREKLPCKICKTPIKKNKLGGRGTFYCEICQK